MGVEIFAEIEGIKYRPLLCKSLRTYKFSEIERAISQNGSFILEMDNENKIGVSWWVSPKRTRSYPYARVYDTLKCIKRLTIIPIIKDEGKDGDRDFLQWDTISLMSLLGVYVIISYYKDADKNPNFRNKITNQRFDIEHIKNEIEKLMSYQSDPLHWNLSQIDNIGEIGRKAIEAYEEISKKLNVEMHSFEKARERINEISKESENFKRLSRDMAKKAQSREVKTTQPKELLNGIKGKLTIKNYLGGYYFFTCDEVEIHDRKVYLIEGKHTKSSSLPSEGDIKDGLLKMILYTNLKNVSVNGEQYIPIPILKLTNNGVLKLSKNKRRFLELLKREAKENNFKLKINNDFVI
jgi:DNA-dependent RNA polymerase auxiliary subunit epsilon